MAELFAAPVVTPFWALLLVAVGLAAVFVFSFAIPWAAEKIRERFEDWKDARRRRMKARVWGREDGWEANE